MPTLLNTLQGHDLSYLRMVANAWGIDLEAPDLHKARPQLLTALADENLILEMLESLTPEAREALTQLQMHKGYLPWAQFSRDYGDVRVMGAAKRDRERPDLNPASPAEILWYRALIGRAFLNLNNEPQEYAYIPDEMLKSMPPPDQETIPLPGRPASPGESKHHQLVTDAILNEVTTLLAGFRLGLPYEKLSTLTWEINPQFLKQLLFTGELIDSLNTPIPDQTKKFLAQPRPKALSYLATAWMNSNTVNELLLTPGLTFEIEPDHHPLPIRKFLLEQISLVPEDQWWNLDSFIQFIYTSFPDFQRPGGDYDSWFIRDAVTKQYLSGFQSWDQVEGEFIRFFITQPLHWLGFVDLAHPEGKTEPTAFKLSTWSKTLWSGQSPDFTEVDQPKIQLDRYGQLKVPKQTALALRYQIARFCEWGETQKGGYLYQLSPRSLHKAAEQGLKVNHLFTLLQNQLKDPFPPPLQSALLQWEQSHQANQISRESLLKVSDPEILKKLQANRANKAIKEILSPTAALIKPGQEDVIRKALLDIGSLTDYSLD